MLRGRAGGFGDSAHSTSSGSVCHTWCERGARDGYWGGRSSHNHVRLGDEDRRSIGGDCLGRRLFCNDGGCQQVGGHLLQAVDCNRLLVDTSHGALSKDVEDVGVERGTALSDGMQSIERACSALRNGTIVGAGEDGGRAGGPVVVLDVRIDAS